MNKVGDASKLQRSETRLHALVQSNSSLKRPPLYPKKNSFDPSPMVNVSMPLTAAPLDAKRITSQGAGVGVRSPWKVLADEIATYVAEIKNGTREDALPVNEKICLIYGSYNGQFLDGVPEGKGSMTLNISKKTYTGAFKRGVPHGEGVEQTSNGIVIYGGSYENGLRHGNGILVSSDKSVWKVKYEKGAEISRSKA